MRTNTKKQLSQKIQNHLDNLTKPKGSLGVLEETALKTGVIQNSSSPKIKNKGTLVFAADHGVVKHGVSAFPQEVTVQMVYNFLQGGAAINVLSNHINSKVFVIDAGVNFDFKDKRVIKNKIRNMSGDIYSDKAMTLDEAKKNVAMGKNTALKLIKKHKLDLIVIGEMGIGNTTPASVLTAKICGLSAQKAAGRGTGVTSEALKNKRRIIAHILKKVKNINCPYKLLSFAGGLEIAQMAGAVLAAAEKKKIVVIDGLISTAAALIAFLINKESANFMFAGHKSTEPAHAAALKKLGLKPLLDLNMRLGEGTGAALAVCVIEASLKIMNEMATFDNAGVSKNL